MAPHGPSWPLMASRGPSWPLVAPSIAASGMLLPQVWHAACAEGFRWAQCPGLHTVRLRSVVSLEAGHDEMGMDEMGVATQSQPGKGTDVRVHTGDEHVGKGTKGPGGWNVPWGGFGLGGREGGREGGSGGGMGALGGVGGAGCVAWAGCIRGVGGQRGVPPTYHMLGLPYGTCIASCAVS